ncbi:MAG: hypothetical protein JWP31_293 [Aeromicrobium sp.]|nr:hypothetical protein [Aeromicrobium sp.]
MTSDHRRGEGPDELELLRNEARSLGLPGQITPESVGVRLATPQEMLARAKASETARETIAESPAPLRSRRRTTAARIGAVAAVVAVIAGVFLTPWRQDTAAAITPPVLRYEFASASDIAYAPGTDARATLLELAALADAQPSSTPSGRTQYLLTDNWFASIEATEAAELIPKQREVWLRPDGTTRVRETSGSPLTPDGRGLSETVASPASTTSNETYPADGLDPQFVSALGTDTSDVRAALLAAGQCESGGPSPERASCLYRQITGLFEQYVVPPRTASVLWRVLADEPSFRSLGSVDDRAGRDGVGISLIPSDAPQFRRVLIISRDTGQLLGTEDILIKDDPSVGVEAPAIYAFTAYLESRYTRRTGPTS